MDDHTLRSLISEADKTYEAHPTAFDAPGFGNPRGRYVTKARELLTEIEEAPPWHHIGTVAMALQEEDINPKT